MLSLLSNFMKTNGLEFLAILCNFLQFYAIAFTAAGSASSHLHTLSPLSKGLFQRVISMSGTALSPWAIVANPGSQAKEFASTVGCPTHLNTSTMISCLRAVDAKTLTKAHIGYIYALAEDKQSVFGPTIETPGNNSSFLSAHPRYLMRSGRIEATVPWLTGVNSEEGLVYLIVVIRNSTISHLLNADWDTYAPKFLQIEGKKRDLHLLKEIKDFYLNGSEVNLDTLRNASNMVSDRAFFLDNHDAVIYHSRVAPVYPYYYTYSGRFAMSKLLFVKGELPFRMPSRYDFVIGAMESWFKEYVMGINEPNKYGVGHSDELPILFDVPLMRRPILDGKDEDYNFSKIMVRLWASFAANGVPDTESLSLPRWIPTTRRKRNRRPVKRYHLGGVNPDMVEEPFYQRLKFWKDRGIK